MDYGQLLIDALGPASFSTPMPAASIDAYADRVPAPLVELWRNHGLACYGGGLFWTIDPSSIAPYLPAWVLMPPASVAFARDAFANLYVLSNEVVYGFDVHFGEREIAAMEFDLLFLAALTSAEFIDSRLQRPLFEAAVRKLGPLEAGECYGCFPAVALGGSFELESLRRVQFIEHIDLLSQLQT